MRGALSPEGSALQGEPQELAHQVANPLGATTVGMPIGADRYDRLLAAISGLDKATSVDEIIGLTLPDA